MHHTLRAATALLCILSSSVLAQPGPPAKPAATQPAAANVLRIITDFDNPPFSFKEGMQRTGIEIEYGEALAGEMGLKVAWVPMRFDMNAYASALDAGKADAAMAAISITGERKESLSFTKPYLRTGLAMAVKSDIDWRHNWFTTGLKHWRVGVMRGTTAEKWARANLSADVQYYSSLDRLVQVLKNSKMPTRDGRGGFCILYDEISLRWALSNYSYRYEIVESGIDPQKYGIAVRKGNTELLKKLNEASARIKESKEGRAIREKWRSRAQGLDFFKED